MMAAIPSESKPHARVAGACQRGPTHSEVSTKGGRA